MATLTESKRQLIDHWRSHDVPENLLTAFEAIPREAFLPEEQKDHAYVDQPLHIGHNQTISQPTTVMNMLTLLDPQKGQTALEIGSGSGYVCALLASLGCKVTGIEIVPELAVSSSQALESINLSDAVAIHAADGGGGWEEGAPYDCILVSCAMPEVPHHLVDQLKEGGILVAPVGRVEQRMLVIKKDKNGSVTEEDHGAYVFVPLQGKLADEEQDDVPGLPFV